MDDKDLDSALASYTVADADKSLLDQIVVTAAGQPANENISGGWFRRSAMLVATAVLGFWLGSVSSPAQTVSALAVSTSAAGTQAAATTGTSTETTEYLDRMIMGPGSLQDMRL